MYRLSGEELGHVLQVLDIRCPNALEKIDEYHDDEEYHDDTNENANASSSSAVESSTELSYPSSLDNTGTSFADEEPSVEINVDVIDARTFAELDRYVKEKMKARSNGVAEALGGDHGGSARKKQKR